MGSHVYFFVGLRARRGLALPFRGVGPTDLSTAVHLKTNEKIDEPT